MKSPQIEMVQVDWIGISSHAEGPCWIPIVMTQPDRVVADLLPQFDRFALGTSCDSEATPAGDAG
jgi:hypothetical protein